MYDNIIEAEKSGSLTDSDIAKMNGRFMHVLRITKRHPDADRKAKRPFNH